MSDHHQLHDDDGNSDVSIADVTLFKNNQGARPPSSEVGLDLNPIQTTSSSARSPVGQPGNVTTQREPIPVPTTSLGYSSQTHNEMIHAPVHDPPVGVPPQFFMRMMDMMQKMSERLCTPLAESKIRISDVYLPSFDPDTNVGVREWCLHIDKAMDQYKLTDFDVRMKICSLLRGRAKMWADDWMVNTSSWEELRSNLITTFEPENRYSRDILRFREHVYEPSMDIAEFLSRAWVLWKRVTKDSLDNGHAVEAVIGCINDERLRIELLNAKATTVPELISTAASIRRKRPHQSSNTTSNKRPRFADQTQSSRSCQICKRTNHATEQCRFKPAEAKPESSSKDPKPPSNISSCTFCKKPGHTYEVCFKRDRSLSTNVNCIMGTKLAPLTVQIGTRSIEAVFDSGAECSIIRESIAAALPGQRSSTVSYLRGIGQFPVMSLTKLLTICVIDAISVELQFFVLSDGDMTTDALIGMNLIHDTN